jgi:biotin carboxyl carrier protein
MPQDWRKLEAAIAELNTLARAAAPRAAFYSTLVNTLAKTIEATRLMMWGEDSPLCLMASYPATESNAIPDTRFAEETFRLGASQRSSEFAGPVITEWICHEPSFRGVLECHLQPVANPETQQAIEMLLASAAQIAGEYERNRALQESLQRTEQQSRILALAAKLSDCESCEQFASVAVNELRTLVPAERVLLFQQRPNRVQLLAVSGAATFDVRSPALQSWLRFVQQIGPLGETHSSSRSMQPLPPEVEETLAEVRETNRASDWALLPLFGTLEGQKTLVGQVALEWFTEAPSAEAEARAEMCLAVIGPQFMRESLRRASPFTKLGDWWAKRQWGVRSFSFVQKLGWGLLVSCVLLAIALIPVPFHISATGELWPVERQHLFAPADGIVSEIVSKSSAYQSGEPLILLENKTWQIERDETRSQLAMNTEALQTAETERLQLADGSALPAQAAQLAARIEQLQAKQRELTVQHELLSQRQQSLSVEAPFKGNVISWDWQRELTGRPVKRGEQLCTLANLQGEWELEIRIPGRESFYVTNYQRITGEPPQVMFRLANTPAQSFKGYLAELSPAVSVSEQQAPHLVSTVRGITPDMLEPRPGASANVSIECGRRSLAFVWLRPLWELFQEWMW